MFGAQEVRGKLHRRLVPIYFIFQTWALFSTLPLSGWVGYLLVVRGQQAAICWPAGGTRI